MKYEEFLDWLSCRLIGNGYGIHGYPQELRQATILQAYARRNKYSLEELMSFYVRGCRYADKCCVKTGLTESGYLGRNEDAPDLIQNLIDLASLFVKGPLDSFYSQLKELCPDFICESVPPKISIF